ncbi:MAG: phytanoyl-CoA dioxygenase family protein [Actinomycetota bacterium]
MDGVRLHPWNRGFQWRDHVPPFTYLDAEQVRRYDEDGFFVLEDVVAADQLAEVVAALDEREARVDEALGSIEGERFHIAERGAITFAPNLVGTSEVLSGFSTHPTLLALCADLIGPDVNLYWDQAVYKKPDKPRRFPWHQDNGYTFVEPQAYLTCWVALTDATEDNGCPWVAPGLHRRGTLEHRWVDPLGWEAFTIPPVEAVAAPVGAGGVVVFSSLTPHLTGPNLTESVRKSYIVQYAPAGAEVLEAGDGDEPLRRTADDATIQYPILRGGTPVPAPTG